MELLDGKSLADVLEQEGQLAPGRALHILAHILRGLAHIHAAGLIHRDIKPENIFLIRQGEDVDFAKILDFGIAKPMAASDLDDGVQAHAGRAWRSARRSTWRPSRRSATRWTGARISTPRR